MESDDVESAQDLVRRVAHSMPPADFGSTVAIMAMAQAIQARDAAIARQAATKERARIAGLVLSKGEHYLTQMRDAKREWEIGHYSCMHEAAEDIAAAIESLPVEET